MDSMTHDSLVPSDGTHAGVFVDCPDAGPKDARHTEPHPADLSDSQANHPHANIEEHHEDASGIDSTLLTTDADCIEDLAIQPP